MSIIKERIRNNNQDVILKVNLGVGNRLTGYQQEVEYLTEETKEELINPVVDYEVNRYSHEANQINNIFFYFSNYNGTSHNNTFANAGFNSTEISTEDDVVLNSFFIMDFYDSYDNNTQTKLFTTYLTKILDSEIGGGVPIPKYVLSNSIINQFFYQYVPKWFIDNPTGINNGSYLSGGVEPLGVGNLFENGVPTQLSVYVKFSFYNAKYGTVLSFYNPSYSPLSSLRQYFKAYLYPNNAEWNFENSNINAYQFPPNNTYAGKINDTVSIFDNLQQNPATGAFDSIDGTYDGGLPRTSRSSSTGTRTVGTSTGGRTVGDRTTSTSTTTPSPDELEDPTTRTRPARDIEEDLPN